ncbi:acyl-CoA desaturase [Streptomyces sp. NBC_00237]|uniref:fatty acid desaturase family protein n=1 Tax=Streptomyces sp. NBC_00237 TaxID=2975687 RepID=UPI0022586E33|nr:fatty acid desaturase [Streptomyces sp. NBC_00237]MCX5206671.1 acyl-CoA desaturase [Streptomyces sp. NBC_00237]
MTTAEPATEPRPGPRTPQNDYALLLARMRSHGLLRRRPGWYLLRIGALVALLGVLWWALRGLGGSWWAVGGAVPLAFLSAQAGFLGHDAAHEQVFPSHRANAWTAFFLGNVLTGTSHAWWRDEHNRHHRYPNDPGRDPNVADVVLSLSPERAVQRHGVKRLLARHQAWLYFPATLLQGANLHHVSIRALRRKDLRCRTVSREAEATGLLVHAVGYTGLLLAAMPLGHALVFAVLHHALWGLYLGATFAPNHKGMPVLTPEDARDPVRRQAVTARNIAGGRFVEFLYGGLNHQIEHHLFPTMPRPSLRRAAPLVEEFCRARDIPYVTETLTGTYVQVLRHLHDAGAPLRVRTP